MENKTMKNKENKRQESEEQENTKELEFGSAGGFSIFNDSYPLFMAYDLTRNLPDEQLPEQKEEKEKPASYRYDAEALKAIEQFKAYSTKIRPPME
jgi:hypothetical protein